MVSYQFISTFKKSREKKRVEFILHNLPEYDGLDICTFG